jgi:uncharacterized membrane protein
MAAEKDDRRISSITESIYLFFCGAIIYMSIEIAYRGYTHWSMGVVGGLCFLIIGGLNNYVDKDMPVIKQGLIGGVVVTLLELLAGLILNIWLKLDIWNYSTVPLNLWGQICLPFSCLWCGLSIVAVYVDDFIRWIVFKETFPKHKWW